MKLTMVHKVSTQALKKRDEYAKFEFRILHNVFGCLLNEPYFPIRSAISHTKKLLAKELLKGISKIECLENTEPQKY